MLEPFYQDHLATIYNGDALKVLKELPDESVQMCMTSPPYWGLRNYADGANIVWGDNHCNHEWIKETYEHQIRTGLGLEELGKKYRGGGHKAKEAGEPTIVTQGFCTKCGAWLGQLGLEPTPELYVEHLMMIFREVKRILKKDGSFYLNIADTYVSGKGSCFNPGGGNKSWQSWNDRKVNYPTGRDAPNRMCKTIPPKCMACIPERVLFAMLEDGWILRNKIIWHKTNYMPGSQKDRFTQSWEYLYFFTKSRKYYFDLDAVRIPHKTINELLTRVMKPFGKRGSPGYRNAPVAESYGGFNLRVRDVKRGKKGTSAQNGELKASEEEIKDYEYPEKMQRHHGSGPQYKLSGLQRGQKHHGSSMTNQMRLHRDRTPRQENIIGHFEDKGSGGHYLYGGLESPEGVHEHPKGKNPGDLWSIATKPSSISVCPKCETVFPRLIKICPNCKVEGIVGHFAPYPEALCTGPIKASSRVGDIILDIFAGGGTTGVAAKRLGRQAILIDCVRPYCIMARYKLQRVEYQPEIRHSSQNG